MKVPFLYGFLSGLMCLLISCHHYPTEFCSFEVLTDSIPVVTRIGFGSCAKESQNQPILKVIADKQPDLFIYMGDNIYANTEDMEEMRGKYGLLSCKEEFQYLMASQPVIATWDDHDYGANDAGAEYPQKQASKEIFLEFWQEPAGSARWTHPGIYTSYYWGDTAHRVQIILLDMRTFRSPPKKQGTEYIPDTDPTKTFLGNEQWAWLENELQQPATIRIIGSSSEFASEENGDENWSNFPLEQQKMYNLIQTHQVKGLFFISGDVHYAELSKRDVPGLYPLYDFTSSGLTHTDPIPDGNQYRVGDAYAGKNFGMIEIHWSSPGTPIHFLIYNDEGNIVYNYSIFLTDLDF
jgi:alkaline phosphatase D